MNYDYIIIGGGSAGCVLANRLSKNPKNSVLLVEAGKNTHTKEMSIPIGHYKLFKQDVDWNYKTSPQKYSNNKEIYMPRGRVLGGSGMLNSMIFIRGNVLDYNNWAALGNKGWSYNDVLPYFIKSENQKLIENNYHGNEGPMTVSLPKSPNPLTNKFIEACYELGFKENNDFNGASQDGYGYYPVNIENGKRVSSYSAYLKPALSRKNLTVLTESHVTKIWLSDNKHATGIDFEINSKIKHARALKEIVLCAGTINSPQLLLLSGIGDQKKLSDLGITIQHHLKGVGKNLMDHPFIPVSFSTNNSSSLDTAESFGNLLKYYFTKKGPYTSNIAEAGYFYKTNPELLAPDMQFFFLPCYFVNHGFDNPKGNGFTFLANLIAPKSKGYISLSSSKPKAKPFINPNHLEHPDDLEALINGYKLAKQFAHTSTLSELIDKPYQPDSYFENDNAIAEYVKDQLEAMFHPVGTCKMGNDNLAVVDDKLRVHGIDKLRIADASIMPEIIRGNTNAPTIMIAEKAADLILEE